MDKKLMNSNENGVNGKFLLLCIVTVAMLLITRGLSLVYQMDIHPDEEVFHSATQSLLNALLYGTEFVEDKPYPEGAYLFQLPFHALGLLVNQITDQYLEPRFWGRCSSVFYFIIAVLIGMRMEFHYLGKNLKSVVLYALTMTFSLFFIEHSRYGVGDMISLFLLMAIIECTVKWCQNKHFTGILYVAAFLSGALGAVKYPQLYFLLIPVVTWCCAYRENRKKKIQVILIMLLACFSGLMLFSPKAITDWTYFAKAISREMDAYVFEAANPGIHNNIARLLIHHLFFLEFPLAFFFICKAVIQKLCNHPVEYCKVLFRDEDATRMLFSFVIPIVTFGFFFYNLLVPNFVMRTFTPYIGLCVLYTAQIVCKLFDGRKWQKALVLLLTLFMVLRGACMVSLLSTDALYEEYMNSVMQVINEQDGRGRIITFRLSRISQKPIILGNREFIKQEVHTFEEFNDYDMTIREGDIVLIGALDFANGEDYPLPVLDEDALKVYYAWEYFKKVNQEFLVARSTPGWPYYLLGSSVAGSSFAGFSYPRSYVYYHPIAES